MDALALISDELGDSDDDEDDDDPVEEPDAKRQRSNDIDFKSLQKAGFQTQSLEDSEMYQKEWAARLKKDTQDEEEKKRIAEEKKAETEALIASSRFVERREQELEAGKVQEQEIERLLESQAYKARRKAGLSNADARARSFEVGNVPKGYGLSHVGENIRVRNKRKGEMGQAQWSLKDDRDCINPFVDSSHAEHVKRWTGKRESDYSSSKSSVGIKYVSI